MLMHADMQTTRTTIVALLVIAFVGSGPWEPWATAERLLKSDHESTLQPRCDLCWYPSPEESTSNRLPSYKQQRPRRPPDSRPQRFPKGRYKLGPKQKQSPVSTLRTQLRRNARLLSTLQMSAIDGDTIRVGQERIRLRGIDTPELSEPDGLAAKERLETLLRSGTVSIVPRGRDVYDRLIADVFVNGQNVAEILRSEGFAKAG
jgi:micrococcal nuclease